MDPPRTARRRRLTSACCSQGATTDLVDTTAPTSDNGVMTEVLRADAPPAYCAVCANQSLFPSPASEEVGGHAHHKCPTCGSIYDERKIIVHAPGAGIRRSVYWSREGPGVWRKPRARALSDHRPFSRHGNSQKEALSRFRAISNQNQVVSGSSADMGMMHSITAAQVAAAKARTLRVRNQYPFQTQNVIWGLGG